MGRRSWAPLAVLAVAALLLPMRETLAAERMVRSSLAVVDSVKANSIAAASGMKAGDDIVQLNAMKNPTLEGVLAYRFDREYAGDTAFTLKRDKARLSANLPQGDWGCEFRPDLSGEALARLDGARESLKGDETWQEGQKKWEALAAEVERGGFRDAACWLKLELARALAEKRRWKKALEILDPLSGKMPETRFWTFKVELEKAGDLRGAGENDRAHEAYSRARNMAKSNGSELRLAGATHAWRAFEYGRGRLSEARALAEETLEIRLRVAPGSLAVAASYNSLGLVTGELGEPATAREHHLKALAIRERLAPGSLEVAASLNNLGLVEWNEGNLAAAREYFLRSLAIRDHFAPASLDVASSLNNLGNIAWRLGDLAGAREIYLRALAIKERLAPKSSTEAATLNNLGTVAALQGDAAGAQEYFLRVLAIQEQLAPESMDVAMTLDNLGVAAHDRMDLAASKEYHLRALAIENAIAPATLDTAMTLNNLGAVARDQGDGPAAREYQTKALEIRERKAPGSLDVAMSLQNLGLLAKDAGDFAAAKDYCQKALAIRERQAPGSLGVAETLQALAAIEHGAGNRSGQENLLEKAVDALESQRGMAGGESAKASFAAAHGNFYTDLMEAYLDDQKPERALETLERSRARALLEMVSSRQIDLRGEIPEALLDKQRDLATQRKGLYDKLSEAGARADPKDIDAWRSELLMLPQREDALAEEIRKASPRLAALEYPKPLNYTGIAEAVDPGTLLVAFAVAEKESYLFALHGGADRKPTLKTVRLPQGNRALEVRVRAFRSLMGAGAATGPDPEAWKKAGGSLYEALFGPISQEIASCERILLIPDGPLHLLPFTALLPTGGKAEMQALARKGRHPQTAPKGPRPPKAARPLDPGVPLGLQRPISIEASMTVYAELKIQGPKASSAPTSSWTGFGDPIYPDPEKGDALRGEMGALRTRGFDLKPLPGSRAEVEAISTLFGAGSKKLLGADATEDAVRALPKDTPFLHFACHGFIDPAFPMDSALVLTAPPAAIPGGMMPIGDNRKDGILQAWEIIQDVRLDSDCVVLSACETGAGKVLGGEGIMGLTRAFFYAGAKSVVVSLWPISDDSTATLMVHFYKEILAGSPRDIALMRAQGELFRSGQDGATRPPNRGLQTAPAGSTSSPSRPSADSPIPSFSHPFYWAAFEIHGRPD